ncbi:hypothetical protein GGS24DRAFT_454086 [Hypoxylon argillaceum]|nr:hypothetical protein GGS24DRAFT_454086 [Hypoxylon argillaceum]
MCHVKNRSHRPSKSSQQEDGSGMNKEDNRERAVNQLSGLARLLHNTKHLGPDRSLSPPYLYFSFLLLPLVLFPHLAIPSQRASFHPKTLPNLWTYLFFHASFYVKRSVLAAIILWRRRT